MKLVTSAGRLPSGARAVVAAPMTEDVSACGTPRHRASADFLNELCELSGCHLLLDLHNLHVNSRNHGLDPFEFLGRVNLDRVVELHLGGGLEYGEWYLDAHSGPTPDPVWDLLEWVLPRAPNVSGVVFELLGSWFEPMGPERLTAELERMQEAWARHQPAPVT